jgi:hypothetical protein
LNFCSMALDPRVKGRETKVEDKVRRDDLVISGVL